MIMSSKCRPSKGDRSSIKYWWIPLEVQSFKSDKICSNGGGYAHHSISRTKSDSHSEAKSSISRVSTPQLVSAAAGIWNRFGQPAVFQTKANLKCNISQKENIICISGNQRKHESAGASAGTENVIHDLKPGSQFSSAARLNFQDLKTLKKVILFASCNRNITDLCNLSDPRLHIDSSSDLANNCESKTRKDPLKFAGDDSDGKNERSVGGKGVLADFSAAQSTENHGPPVVLDSSTGETLKRGETVMHPHAPLYASYALQPLKSTREAIVVLRNRSSGVHSNYNIECSTSVDCAPGQRQQATDSCNMVSESSMEVSGIKSNNGHESGNGLFHELGPDEEFPAKHWLSIQDKLQQVFAKNRHALAGALAGTLVSLCLHPVDTVKTIIQFNGMGQKSIYDILKTITAEKGVLGLYRGIASNIASSAPISAIYTCTYESVKGAMLPILPKEYCSVAHCIAGGCSSIATSFIYTPSERIKQQMQVGSQYQNSWNALIGCLGKGGVPSLYAGWGAVLCRNIPHSIIKFYTYERLKQLFLRSGSSDASLNTLQTLVCGGLAGSTAALFTTPFDVVKTRLQTQAPGSLAKYSGVLHALQEIAREEGLQGLYRGLTPRLAMYVSQGAIFFASYEFLKAVFALETPTPPNIIIEEEKADGPTPSRMRTLHT